MPDVPLRPPKLSPAPGMVMCTTAGFLAGLRPHSGASPHSFRFALGAADPKAVKSAPRAEGGQMQQVGFVKHPPVITMNKHQQTAAFAAGQKNIHCFACSFAARLIQVAAPGRDHFIAPGPGRRRPFWRIGVRIGNERGNGIGFAIECQRTSQKCKAAIFRASLLQDPPMPALAGEPSLFAKESIFAPRIDQPPPSNNCDAHDNE